MDLPVKENKQKRNEFILFNNFMRFHVKGFAIQKRRSSNTTSSVAKIMLLLVNIQRGGSVQCTGFD